MQTLTKHNRPHYGSAAELHAHLSGSISRQFLRKALRQETCDSFLTPPQNLKDCFEYFKWVHTFIRSKEELKVSTRAVLESFANDGVKYLELRTSPKHLADGTSPASYIATVLDEMYAIKNIESNLILSIDRSRGCENAAIVTRLFEAFSKEDKLVGADFSGNPKISSFSNYRHFFDSIRRLGFKTTLHCAETKSCKDTDAILDFQPDRIGHAIWLNEKQEQRILDMKIPVEVCYSSNLIAAEMGDMQHNVINWHKHNHPFIICTDDTGLFNTNQVHEYQQVSSLLKLSPQEQSQLAKSSLNYTFSRK